MRVAPFQPGAVFGRLTIEEHLGRSPRGIKAYRAICLCGDHVIVLHSDLRRGDTTSCGCAKRDAVIARNKALAKGQKHAMLPEYSSWAAARRRCLNKRAKDYMRYGGAGVTFCNVWAVSFAAFLDHIGPRPTGTSLDRIDSTKGYEPGNVRWATAEEQCANRKTTRWVDVNGVSMPAAQAANLLGITPTAAYKRLKNKGTIYGDPRSNRKNQNQELA